MQKRGEHIEDILLKYFSNQLTESDEKELLEWLESDLANKKTLYRMADWWATAHVPLFVSDRESDFREHLKKLSNQTATTQKKQSIDLSIWYKIAASILVLLTVGISFFYWGKNQQPAPQTAYYKTSVPLGSQSKIILPDQSTVWLNAGSSLTYYEDHNNQTRNTTLEGEGYFEVSPDPDKPFVVNSEDMHITVLGTSFNLKAYKEEATIDLVLISGKVDVNLTKDMGHIENHVLSPNQLLAYNREEQAIEVSAVFASNYGKWRNRILRFDEKSFNQLAKDLERIYNTPIEIKSKLLIKESFSGSFSYDYSLDQILKEIDVEKKYKWRYKDKKLIIEDK